MLFLLWFFAGLSIDISRTTGAHFISRPRSATRNVLTFLFEPISKICVLTWPISDITIVTRFDNAYMEHNDSGFGARMHKYMEYGFGTLWPIANFTSGFM